MGIGQYLIDFVFPKRCVVCNRYEVNICKDCLISLPRADQICPMCCHDSMDGWTHERCRRRLGMDGLSAVWLYKDENVKKIIEEIKFGFNKEVISEMLEDLPLEWGMVFDLIVPVPLFRYRENWRGFNQAEEIGMVVAKKMNMSQRKVLLRIKNTRQQARIDDKKERRKNVEGAFVVREGEREFLKGKKVLLVDDVFTSGASMVECCKELKRGGAEMVWGMVLAH